jgi:hypothetical protein
MGASPLCWAHSPFVAVCFPLIAESFTSQVVANIAGAWTLDCDPCWSLFLWLRVPQVLAMFLLPQAACASFNAWGVKEGRCWSILLGCWSTSPLGLNLTYRGANPRVGAAISLHQTTEQQTHESPSSCSSWGQFDGVSSWLCMKGGSRFL